MLESTIIPLGLILHVFVRIGAAHGLSGILQMLLSFPEFYSHNPNDLNLVKQSIDFLLSCEQDGNIPPDLENTRCSSDDELVHWCHGSPGMLVVLESGGSLFIFLGVIYAIARAYMVFKEEK